MRRIALLLLAAGLSACVSASSGHVYEELPLVTPEKGPPPAELVDTARKMVEWARAGNVEALDPFIDDRFGERPYDDYATRKPRPRRPA